MLKLKDPKKYAKEYYGTKRGHLSAFLGHAKNRAKKRNLEKSFLTKIKQDLIIGKELNLIKKSGLT